MIVNTTRLFSSLLSRMQIGAVCDVGSMNGAEALIFRKELPHSNVYAFEPNPRNFELMRLDPRLQRGGIQLVPLAVTNQDGVADFFVIDADYSCLDYRRGMSSLHKRTEKWVPASVVEVKTTRLDTFLADKCPLNARLALWIDTEGKAHEVIEGISGIAERVHLVHIEVETVPCIGSDQKLYTQVKELLQHLGLVEVATDQLRSHSQFNALFIRRESFTVRELRVNVCLTWARVRQMMLSVIRRVCPECLRRFQGLRRRWSSQFDAL